MPHDELIDCHDYDKKVAEVEQNDILNMLNMPTRVNSQITLNRVHDDEKSADFPRLSKKLSGNKKIISMQIDMMQNNQTHNDNKSKI